MVKSVHKCRQKCYNIYALKDNEHNLVTHNYLEKLLRRKGDIFMAQKGKTISAHNGKHGNSTREELFIALKYLLEKCPDEKHTSKTVELQQYAEENFHTLLDRRRVNDIFDSLVELTNNNPGVLPYVVKQVTDKPRYYIKKTLFKDKEIESIAKAIQNDQSISTAKADKYMEAFLDVACNKTDKEKFNRKLKKTEMRKPRLNDSENKFKEYIEWLRDTQRRFYFKFKKRVKTGDCTNLETYKKLSTKNGTNEYWAGIIFELYSHNEVVDACIYLPDLRSAVIAHLKDIELNLQSEPTEQWNTVSFYIGENKELDAWVKRYYQGRTGIEYPIKFFFPAGDNDTILSKMRESFSYFFGQELEFKENERKVSRELPDGQIEEMVTKDIIASTYRNYESFRKWFWEGPNKPYEVVTVIFPAAFNDRLLAPITRRFQDRLAHFGYDSENGKLQREEIHKRIVARKKKAEESAS